MDVMTLISSFQDLTNEDGGAELVAQSVRRLVLDRAVPAADEHGGD